MKTHKFNTLETQRLRETTGGSGPNRVADYIADYLRNGGGVIEMPHMGAEDPDALQSLNFKL